MIKQYFDNPEMGFIDHVLQFYLAKKIKSDRDYLNRRINWEKILKLGKIHGLLSFFYYYFQTENLWSQIPIGVATSIRLHYQSQLAWNIRLLKTYAEIKHYCERTEVEFFPLKGIAYLELLYPEVGLRPCSDIDLFVPIEFVPRLSQYFTDLRYEKPFLPTSAHACFEKDDVRVEIHWSLFGSYEDGLFRSRDLLKKGVHPSFATKEDEFIYFVLHFYSHPEKRLFSLIESMFFLEKFCPFSEDYFWKKVFYHRAQLPVLTLFKQIEHWLPVPVKIEQEGSKILETRKYHIFQKKLNHHLFGQRPFKRIILDCLLPKHFYEYGIHLVKVLFPSPAELRIFYPYRSTNFKLGNYFYHFLRMVWLGFKT